MQNFEPGTRCPFTQHTFTSGERGRKCMRCERVLTLSAWNEKRRCFCSNTNLVKAVAGQSNPTQIRPNPGSRRTSATSRQTPASRLSFREAPNSNTSRVTAASSSSSNSGASALGCLASVAMSIFILFWFSSCVSNLFKSTPSSNVSSQTNSNTTATPVQRPSQKYPEWSFPRDECGDSNPPGEQDFYPVFVNKTDSSTLSYVKSQYCRDAYAMTRKIINQKAIQIASFRSKKRADELSNILLADPNVNSAEVGDKTTR